MFSLPGFHSTFAMLLHALYSVPPLFSVTCSSVVGVAFYTPSHKMLKIYGNQITALASVFVSIFDRFTRSLDSSLTLAHP